ncbi:MAG: dTDP-4-amino-4,6-dideoxygalactose transaminase [Desulfomonile tiedjei]|nr:dTDP-4-amino-4,6-dideoxygalactose transaminase [Desulfomonile tiedjei]
MPDGPKIPFNKPFIVGKELYYVAQAVLANKHLSGNGPFTQKCQEWLERQLGCRKALLTHSCTGALEMVAMLCDLKAGDEVIMPSFTFVSTANAFVLRGAVPVFVDIRPDTLNIDENLINQAITPRTKGIIPVHYAGVSCNMDEIMRTAKRHGLWVAEDAAHALLSTYKGRYLGAIGDFGCLSFHETKNVISGEGGALLINSEEFIERAEIIREKGTNRTKFFRGELDKYSWVDVGSSFLPSDLVAAFLYAQLEHAEAIVAARCKIIARYQDLLRGFGDEGLIRLPYFEDYTTCSGHLFYVITRSEKERSELIRHMAQHDILTVFHYVPLHSSPGGIKYGRTAGTMNVTEDVSARVLRLPLYYGMTDDEVETVAKTLADFYGRKI